MPDLRSIFAMASRWRSSGSAAAGENQARCAHADGPHLYGAPNSDVEVAYGERGHGGQLRVEKHTCIFLKLHAIKSLLLPAMG